MVLEERDTMKIDALKIETGQNPRAKTFGALGSELVKAGHQMAVTDTKVSKFQITVMWSLPENHFPS